MWVRNVGVSYVCGCGLGVRVWLGLREWVRCAGVGEVCGCWLVVWV